MRYLALAAFAAAMVLPAAAQKPADRLAKQVTGPDMAVVKEAATTLKLAGECMVTFTVGTDGKPKNIKPACTPADYEPYVVRAMATVEYLPEIFAGEVFETDDVKQPFTFKGAQPKAAEEKPPTVATQIDRKKLDKLLTKQRTKIACQVTMTIGPDGAPKDIAPACDPADVADGVKEAVSEMRFNPATRAGQPVEWKVQLPVNLGK